MKKTRILYVIASSDIGGAEHFVYTFLNSLDSLRFEKYIACPAGGFYAERFRALAKKTILVDRQRSFMNPSVVMKIARFIMENEIDIIHTMLYTSDFCGILARLVSGRGRVINTINGLNFLVLANSGLRIKKRVGSFFYRFIYRYSDALVAVSDAVRRDLLERRGIKTDPKKVSVILAAGTSSDYDNFSEADAVNIRARYIKDEDIVIAAIGMLNEMKDYDTMLEAFAIAAGKNAKLRLLIAGDGPHRERLVRKIASLGVSERVSLMGALEEAKKNAFLSLSDIFLITSISEGCPTAILEAMYFGKPIIATEVGGIPEIISHGNNGVLVPPENPGILAKTILDIAADKHARMRLGIAAKNNFVERFTPAHMLGRYQAVYDKLLS